MKVSIEVIQKLRRRAKKRLISRSGVPVNLFLALYILVSQLFNPINAYSQSNKSIAPDDHALVQVRYPKAGGLHKLQTDHDYQYTTDAPPPENPVARFADWLFRKLARFLTSKSYQNVWQYVILAMIAGCVIYLLTKAEVLSFLFPKKAQSAELDYENLGENIHEINFDAAVDDAVDVRNFRLAVRLLYLQTLKRLTDAGQIDYKPDKTNRQYGYELANSPLQAGFDDLTRQFEFVWYGDFPIDEARFRYIQDQFQMLNGHIAHHV